MQNTENKPQVKFKPPAQAPAQKPKRYDTTKLKNTNIQIDKDEKRPSNKPYKYLVDKNTNDIYIVQSPKNPALSPSKAQFLKRGGKFYKAIVQKFPGILNT